MMYRLDPLPGEWLDRSRRLRFTFEGEPYAGFAGDTLTSALAAAGRMTLARSFKYHRRRGILSFADHDTNTLFQVDGRPNVRGDVTPLADGMRIAAVNTFGGLERDRARVLDRLGRFLPVGFYYKAFHSRRWRAHWERLFRRLTGLGTVSFAAPRERTPKRYAFCDVLVVGGGPSGLAAALAAAEAGARVVLADESARLGGSGLWAGAREREQVARVAELVAAVRAQPRIEALESTYAAGCYADRWVALVEPHRMTKLRARAIVFATGAIEQPAVFRNNDLPGVMLASAAQRLLFRHAIAPGREVVIVTANQEGYEACLDLLAHRVHVSALIDVRVTGSKDDPVAALTARGVRVLRGWAPLAAEPGRDGAVRALKLTPIVARAYRDSPAVRRLPCDALLMSVGWMPACQLLLQAGARLEFDERLQQLVPGELPAGLLAAGRVRGVYGFAARIADGRRAGSEAAVRLGLAAEIPPAVSPGVRLPSHPYPIYEHPRGKNFVDFDEDLQLADLENAAQEGFDSIELLKRFSTVGMGPSQGKHANMNAARVLARIRGRRVQQIGLTTARPMYHPVPLKHLAGRAFVVERRSPLDRCHARLQAVWMPAGEWRRPEYYAGGGASREACIEREVLAVRRAVGLIDVGTLGKIELHGPDAGEFLDRVYAGRFSDLKPGMTRYALMLDEAGTVIDDGVVARLSAASWYFTTTTSGAAAVYRELLRLQALWGLDCVLANATGHRAAFNLAGPASRAVLQPLVDLDLAESACPYLAVRSGRVAGVPARLLRVGFVGELGYEIHVPASRAVRVWEALLAAGAPHGIRPFGVEAQRVLRLEKGHFIVGQDTDGLTSPFEAGARWAVKMQKPFFVGQRSLRMLEARGPRQQLAGLEFRDAGRAPRESHLIIEAGEIAGRITSVARSPTLDRVIALAMLRPDLARIGTRVAVRAGEGEPLVGEVVPTPFYDPENGRQRLEVAA